MRCSCPAGELKTSTAWEAKAKHLRRQPRRPGRWELKAQRGLRRAGAPIMEAS